MNAFNGLSYSDRAAGNKKDRPYNPRAISTAFEKKEPAPQAGLGIGLMLAYLVANRAAWFCKRIGNEGLAFAAAMIFRVF